MKTFKDLRIPQDRESLEDVLNALEKATRHARDAYHRAQEAKDAADEALSQTLEARLQLSKIIDVKD